ncbi:MAG: DNA alkylation repair protein [Lachnospiraceae bacterium]|nr:DNA alkylation repair protein [Lachnospiraceae bacterium]
MDRVEKELFAMQDLSYKEFHAALMPTISPDVIIGVRTPALRKYAKTFAKSEDADVFMKELPHRYYEENNLHGFILCESKDIDFCLEKLDEFLPYIDNWATCDMLRPKVFKKNPERLLPFIDKWFTSGETYTVRYAIGMLLSYFLDEEFKPEYPARVASIVSEEYYVQMMQAWYFATALAKQWDAVIPFIERKCMPKWVHNKTIQKSVESYRLTTEQKEYLRTFRIS